jgi:hypothetical protein
MFILRGADHLHFGDSVLVQLGLTRVLGLLPQQAYDELLATLETCSEDQAQVFTRGLALAHMDSVLKEHSPAQQFLDGDPVRALQERGVGAIAWPTP